MYVHVGVSSREYACVVMALMGVRDERRQQKEGEIYCTERNREIESTK